MNSVVKFRKAGFKVNRCSLRIQNKKSVVMSSCSSSSSIHTRTAAVASLSTFQNKESNSRFNNFSLAATTAAAVTLFTITTTTTTECETSMTNSSPKSSSIQFKPSLKKGPKNVMLSRLRSLRGRSLSDKYTVNWKQVLGEGAYGSVHPARLKATGEKVALKKITKRYTDTSSFCRETDALLRIYNNGGHPNISGLRDMYEDHDYYYLVMDLVSGGEMFDHLIEYGAYSEADAARLMREVASALAFLHGVGVAHADLKPENLLLCSKKRVDGTIKMIDFGCAVVEKNDLEYLEDDDEDSIDDEDNNTDTDKMEHHGKHSTTARKKTTSDLHQTLKSWIETLNQKNNEIGSGMEHEVESTGTTAYW